MVSFVGGREGGWRVIRLDTLRGAALARVPRLAVFEGNLVQLPRGGRWLLRGVPSYERYTTRREHDLLAARQPTLGRPEATHAALIPIAKSAAWWALAQDERRRIFETKSRHIRTGLHYLPAIARRLYHSRDLGGPFDFLTWFEFAPADGQAFDELVTRLRESEEWTYVEREVDIRLVRANARSRGRATD